MTLEFSDDWCNESLLLTALPLTVYKVHPGDGKCPQSHKGSRLHVMWAQMWQMNWKDISKCCLPLQSQWCTKCPLLLGWMQQNMLYHSVHCCQNSPTVHQSLCLPRQWHTKQELHLLLHLVTEHACRFLIQVQCMHVLMCLCRKSACFPATVSRIWALSCFVLSVQLAVKKDQAFTGHQVHVLQIRVLNCTCVCTIYGKHSGSKVFYWWRST